MKILEKIKKYLGGLILILGTGIFSYNIFNFSFKDSTIPAIKMPSGLPSLPGFERGRELGNIAYYYTDNTLLFIAIGAMLIVAGILIIKKQIMSISK